MLPKQKKLSTLKRGTKNLARKISLKQEGITSFERPFCAKNHMLYMTSKNELLENHEKNFCPFCDSLLCTLPFYNGKLRGWCSECKEIMEIKAHPEDSHHTKF